MRKMICLALLLFASVSFAKEGLSICNNTSEDFYILKGNEGYRHPNVTMGWYFIKKGTCKRVLNSASNLANWFAFTDKKGIPFVIRSNTPKQGLVLPEYLCWAHNPDELKKYTREAKAFGKSLGYEFTEIPNSECEESDYSQRQYQRYPVSFGLRVGKSYFLELNID